MVSAVNRMLARVLWPFLAWMAAGWALFPYGIRWLMDIAEEDVSATNLLYVSWLYTAIFAFVAIEAYIIGHAKPAPHGSTLEQTDRKEFIRCPYCRSWIRAEAATCSHCKAWIPR